MAYTNYSNNNIPTHVTGHQSTVPLKPYQQSDPRFKPINQNQLIDLEQKSDDELWTETYLSKIGKIKLNLTQTNAEIITTQTPKSNKKQLKIHVAKNLLHRCIKLLEELRKLEQYLRENVANVSTTEWKEKTIQIGRQKDEFTALLSQFDDTDVLEQLRKALNKRKRKRISQKRKKVARKEEAEEIEKNRLFIHASIDQWLDNMKEEVVRAKREEYLKKDADCVLAEVTKKKSDARKHISLLKALVKLRDVREKAAQQRGEKISLEDSNAFKHNADRLQKMWENALKVYGIEEQGLRVMLEQNATTDELHASVSEEKKITSEWESVLFGPKVIPPNAYWGLTSGEKDLGSFIAIRKSWDTFSVPDNEEDASPIPIGWVLPDMTHATNNNTGWSHYLRNN